MFSTFTNFNYTLKYSWSYSSNTEKILEIKNINPKILLYFIFQILPLQVIIISTYKNKQLSLGNYSQQTVRLESTLCILTVQRNAHSCTQYSNNESAFLERREIFPLDGLGSRRCRLQARGDEHEEKWFRRVPRWGSSPQSSRWPCFLVHNSRPRGWWWCR